MTTIAHVAAAMQRLLTTTADTLGRTTGFTQRRSPLTGAAFAQTLVFGWLSNPQATLEELSQTAALAGTPVSPQALDQRCTPRAATYLQTLLQVAICTFVATDPVAIPLLHRFSGVYLLDSSTIQLPDCFADLWPGCGGNTATHTSAARKVQVRLDLVTGALDGPFLQAGRANDGSAPTQRLPVPPGALRLADRGYFSLAQ